MEDEKVLKAFYDLSLEIVGRAFCVPVKTVQTEQVNQAHFEKWKKENIYFADCKLLKMVCDLSDNLEHGRVKEKIIAFTNKQTGCHRRARSTRLKK